MPKFPILFSLLAMMVFINHCRGALFFVHRSNPTGIQNTSPSKVEYIQATHPTCESVLFVFFSRSNTPCN